MIQVVIKIVTLVQKQQSIPLITLKMFMVIFIMNSLVPEW